MRIQTWWKSVAADSRPARSLVIRQLARITGSSCSPSASQCVRSISTWIGAWTASHRSSTYSHSIRRPCSCTASASSPLEAKWKYSAPFVTPAVVAIWPSVALA